jgi:hypothetical protein
MLNEDQYKEAHFYFTVLEFAEIVNMDSIRAFQELEYSCPNILKKLTEYLCEKHLVDGEYYE